MRRVENRLEVTGLICGEVTLVSSFSFNVGMYVLSVIDSDVLDVQERTIVSESSSVISFMMSFQCPRASRWLYS